MEPSSCDDSWGIFQRIDHFETLTNQPSGLSSDAWGFGGQPQRCHACGPAPAPPYSQAGPPDPNLGHKPPENWGWLLFQNPSLTLTGHVSTPIDQTSPEHPVFEPGPHISSSHGAHIRGAFDFGETLAPPSIIPGDLGSLLVPPEPEAAHFEDRVSRPLVHRRLQWCRKTTLWNGRSSRKPPSLYQQSEPTADHHSALLIPVVWSPKSRHIDAPATESLTRL